jgi:hypothetical protein
MPPPDERGRPRQEAASEISTATKIETSVDRWCCPSLDLTERERLAAAGATCGPNRCARDAPVCLELLRGGRDE